MLTKTFFFTQYARGDFFILKKFNFFFHLKEVSLFLFPIRLRFLWTLKGNRDKQGFALMPKT